MPYGTIRQKAAMFLIIDNIHTPICGSKFISYYHKNYTIRIVSHKREHDWLILFVNG